MCWPIKRMEGNFATLMIFSGKDAPDAVAVLRKALAQAEDGSVVIAQVGFSTNLANLLDSKPDAVSPWTECLW